MAHVEGSGTAVVIVAEKVASRELFIAEFQTGPSARTLAQTRLPRLGIELELQPTKARQSPTVAEPWFELPF
jgi:hypothetical protein